MRAVILSMALSFVVAVPTYGSLPLQLTGLAGTGVTADVSLSYLANSDTAAQLSITITNTTTPTIGGVITAWGFNAPMFSGSSFTSFGGDIDDAGSQLVTALTSPNESGWYIRYDSENIKSNNGAGFFDVGIMNNGSTNAFITDGRGTPSSPKIVEGETTSFTIDILGSGLLGITTQAFLDAFSTGGSAGAFNFGLRYQQVGPNGDDSDFAVANVVPIPSAMLLALVGLPSIAIAHRRQRAR